MSCPLFLSTVRSGVTVRHCSGLSPIDMKPPQRSRSSISLRSSKEKQRGLAYLRLQIKCLFKGASPDVAAAGSPAPGDRWGPQPCPRRTSPARTGIKAAFSTAWLCWRHNFLFTHKRARSVFSRLTERNKDGFLLGQRCPLHSSRFRGWEQAQPGDATRSRQRQSGC